MATSAPQFSELNEIEESLLVAKLRAVRMAINHAGEKGRALEHGVRELLRGILPAAYGISTGFIVYHTERGPRLSSQLDIIIYDAIRSGPIIRLETCDVFPLEAVYAYVEVKATLCSTTDEATDLADNSIEQCLINSYQLRKMTERRFWAGLSQTSTSLYAHNWMSIRSYVFAFEAQGSIANQCTALAQRMANFSAKLGHPAHLSGLLIADHGFFYTQPVDPLLAQASDCFHVKYTDSHPLRVFKTHLLEGLITFPKPQDEWSVALEQYFGEQKLPLSCAPQL